MQKECLLITVRSLCRILSAGSAHYHPYLRSLLFPLEKLLWAGRTIPFPGEGRKTKQKKDITRKQKRSECKPLLNRATRLAVPPGNLSDLAWALPYSIKRSCGSPLPPPRSLLFKLQMSTLGSLLSASPRPAAVMAREIPGPPAALSADGGAAG